MDIVEDRRWLASCIPRVTLMRTGSAKRESESAPHA